MELEELRGDVTTLQVRYLLEACHRCVPALASSPCVCVRVSAVSLGLALPRSVGGSPVCVLPSAACGGRLGQRDRWELYGLG
jgi:hypothetical protein